MDNIVIPALIILVLEEIDNSLLELAKQCVFWNNVCFYVLKSIPMQNFYNKLFPPVQVLIWGKSF